MPAIAPALRLTLGQQYGPLTQDYARRVEQAGGRFDAGGRAVAALDRMLYGRYSNGAGGDGSVAELAHGFLSFWAPVSDFVGIAPCIVGPDVIVNGYVSSNWNLNGLSGNGIAGRYLNSQIGINRLSSSVNGLGWYNNTTFALNALQLCGGRNSTSTYGFDCGANTSGTYRIRPSTSVAAETPVATPGTGLLMMSRVANSGIGSVKFFQVNSTETLFNITGLTTTSTDTIWYGAFNAAGTSTAPMLNRYNAAFITNNLVFDTPQVTILRNALDALNTARAAL